MSGHRPWRQIRQGYGDTERDERRLAFQRGIESALSLAELREQVGMTQAQVAERLKAKQPNVSRLEHQEDLYLSTLQEYIEALGGELEVAAVFPEARIPIGPIARHAGQ